MRHARRHRHKGRRTETAAAAHQNGTKKLKNRQQKRSLEGLRGVENEVLELSRALGAPMWVKSGPQERSKSLLGAPRGPKTIHRTRPGAPRADLGARFRYKGTPVGRFWPPFWLPRGCPGALFLQFFEKSEKCRIMWPCQ